MKLLERKKNQNDLAQCISWQFVFPYIIRTDFLFDARSVKCQQHCKAKRNQPTVPVSLRRIIDDVFLFLLSLHKTKHSSFALQWHLWLTSWMAGTWVISMPFRTLAVFSTGGPALCNQPVTSEKTFFTITNIYSYYRYCLICLHFQILTLNFHNVLSF